MTQNLKRSDGGYFPLFRLLPNVVTLTSLCIALSAIKFALNGDFFKASGFLLLAGFMDGVDGRLARFLKTESEFGAQLDSLVDFVNFGVTPGFVVYSWIAANGGFPTFDWALVLFFAVCSAIRLARFNVALNKTPTNPTLAKYFFQGIPAPVGAAMAMLPMVLAYEFGDGFYTSPLFILIYTAFLAVLMASRLPTISIKKIPIKNEHAYITLLVLGSIIIGLIIKPWLTLAIIGIIYAISLPVTVYAYHKIAKKSKTHE